MYVDCDGPETRLPDVFSDFLPTGWRATSPCAVDVPSRVLTNVITSTDPAHATPYNCASFCQSTAPGYHYAGLEYGTECHCGTGYAGGVLPTAANVSDCSMHCTGDYHYLCGGSWRIELYSIA